MTTKELVFPSGVGRRLNFRQEAGKRDRYLSPWSLNVRLEDFTGRLRGGSWTPQAAPVTPASQTVYLTNSAGVRITDSSGNQIVVGTQISAVHSGGTAFLDPGSSAPASHPTQCVYRGRFVRPTGSIVFLSRMGNYTDWDYGVDISDSGRAFAIQLAEAGEIGGNVTALIPHKDAYMLAATADSLWVIQGDPAADGGMRNISRGVGIVGAKAWCRDHLDRYYFLSSHGLYTVSPSGEGLQALSEDVVPEQLTGVTDVSTELHYDHETRGVHIYIQKAGDVSWMFDTERQGFWPFTVGYAGSHVAIGPVALGNGSTFGRLLQLHGILAQGSASVAWRVLVADTAEQVSANAKLAIEALVAGTPPLNIHSSGIWTGTGANHRSYPRARGKYMILLLSSESGLWAWEGANAVVQASGSWR
jgi:hypothetical protein